MSIYHIAGNIQLTARTKGDRATIETAADTAMMDICLYAGNKYPQYNFECKPLSIRQKVSDMISRK